MKREDDDSIEILWPPIGKVPKKVILWTIAIVIVVLTILFAILMIKEIFL